MSATTATPAITVHVQRLTALERANEVRTFRSDLKRKLKRAELLLTDVLADGHPDLRTMLVMELLIAAPHVGRVKATKALRKTGISPSAQVRQLSDGRRRELLAVLYGGPQA